MNRLLLVDGSNLLFQMFFGMPSRIVGKNGREIRGTLGFVGALIKIIKMTSPTHILVLFDGEVHNPRTDLDPDYKANRPDYSALDDTDNPFTQLPDIYAALDSMNIPRYETVDCEADDIIASYCRSCDADTLVTVSSFDSDLFQLVGERVRILRYRGENSVFCDTGYVLSRLGVPPERYADYKSLVGDTSDNIRGVTGIGPKTAAALINEYGSLEGLVAHADEITRPRLRASIIAERERITKNASLIRLAGDAPLPFGLPALAYAYDGRCTRAVLDAIGL